MQLVLAEVSQLSDGTNNERLPTTNELVTEKANDPYCKEVQNIAGKPGSAYSYDKNGLLIKQA